MGTLDAVSAGILVLVWVGVLDMWARDWVVAGGDMAKFRMAEGTDWGDSIGGKDDVDGRPRQVGLG
jgi:solute carrier family 39 (zinc transporter), member 1/2/3